MRPSPPRSQRGLGEQRVQWRLRDWGISRQRYWGCPIPLIHCARCGEVPVPDEDLPVRFPKTWCPMAPAIRWRSARPSSSATAQAAAASARRETDTMDTFVDSSWYFLRFASANQQAGRSMRARILAAGGPVHRRHRARDPAPAVLALLDARDARPGAGEAQRAVQQPADAGHGAQPVSTTASRPPARRVFNPAEVERHDAAGSAPARGCWATASRWSTAGSARCRSRRTTASTRRRWSKKYGADTARLFMMFAAPPEQTLEWSDEGVQGQYRFLRRLWKAVHEHVARRAGAGARGARALHGRGRGTAPAARTRRWCASATTSAGGACSTPRSRPSWSCSTRRALSTTPAQAARAVRQEALEIAVLCLSPIVPHICHVLWRALGHERALIDEPWPQPDAAALVQQDRWSWSCRSTASCAAQVRVAAGADEATARAAALAARACGGSWARRRPRRVIYVPGKLVNIVV